MKLNKEENTISFNIWEFIFYNGLILCIINLIDIISHIFYPSTKENLLLSFVGLIIGIIASYYMMIGFSSKKFVSRIEFKR